MADLEARLAAALKELTRETDLQRAAEQREGQIRHRNNELESELLTAGVSKDGLSHEKQQVSWHTWFILTVAFFILCRWLLFYYFHHVFNISA